MKLPIRNRSGLPLTLFIEPYCDQHEIPPDGEAIVTLTDGYPHSMDFHPENWVSLWDEGETQAIVEVVTKEQTPSSTHLPSRGGGFSNTAGGAKRPRKT